MLFFLLTTVLVLALTQVNVNGVGVIPQGGVGSYGSRW